MASCNLSLPVFLQLLDKLLQYNNLLFSCCPKKNLGNTTEDNETLGVPKTGVFFRQEKLTNLAMARKLYDLASSNVSEHLAYLEKDPRGPKRQDGDRSFLVVGLLFRKISNSMSVWLGAYFMQVIVVWLILFTCLSIDKACQVLYKTMSIEILA